MILSVNNISKSFHEVPVLKDVSFHIEDYEKAAIVGINGAGKTTLLQIIGTLSTPDSGTVAIDGGPLQKTKPSGISPSRMRFREKTPSIRSC